MFVLIFTCLNVRAVHFELLPDMSTRNFVLAFQRFCNMYSSPQYLYSDNAKTFIKPQAPDGVYKPPLVYSQMGFINALPFPALHLSRNATIVSESLKISDQRMAKRY